MSSAVFAQCEAFPQYRVAEADAIAAARVAQGIVEENATNHLEGTPDYRLLSADFFEAARQEAHAAMVEGLHKLAEAEKS